MRSHSDCLTALRATLLREARLLTAVAESLDDTASEAVDALLRTKGHILAGGAGTSSAVAARFAHLLACCGAPAVFIHPADSLHGSSGAVRSGDTLVLISKGGKTAEVNQFARIAKSRGATVIVLTEDGSSELGEIADISVTVRAGDNDPFGMVATGSSLANAAVGDAICEAILERSGYTLAEFAATHPGGAVGCKIRQQGLDS